MCKILELVRNPNMINICLLDVIFGAVVCCVLCAQTVCWEQEAGAQMKYFHEKVKTQYLSPAPIPKSTGPRTHYINLLSDSNPLASAYWVLAYTPEPLQLAFLILGSSLAPVFHVSNVLTVSDVCEELWENWRRWAHKFTVPCVPDISQSPSDVDWLTLSQLVTSAVLGTVWP